MSLTASSTSLILASSDLASRFVFSHLQKQMYIGLITLYLLVTFNFNDGFGHTSTCNSLIFFNCALKWVMQYC